MKKLLKDSGAKVFKRFYAGRGQILMFHRILPSTKSERIRNTGIEVSPEKLEEVIQFFKQKRYAFIGLDELPDYLLKDKGKFVIFTFDDGYEDNYSVAFPVFKKHAVPFTIYVTTDFPEEKAIMWWYLLEDLLLEKQELVFQFKQQSYSYCLANLPQKEKAFEELRRMIIDAGTKEKAALFHELFVKNGIDLFAKTQKNALSWGQLAELAKNELVTIGAHTQTHSALATLSPEQIQEEVMGSKKLLEEKLGIEILHFAYPFGSRKEAGEREFSIVKSLGFKTATTTREGNIFKAHSNFITALPRLYIGPKTSLNQVKDFVEGITPFRKGVFHRVMTV